jgi:methionyl-tRNA formyltransferase
MKVFFLVNNLDEFDFSDLLKKYLNGVDITVNDTLPTDTDEYNLIILWSYRKIIPNISQKKNILIFHSSDLPYGKGWAPIYYSIASGLQYYTISGILPADIVDCGDIVVKARFKIRDNYTADIIRKWDNEISIILIKKILEKFGGREITGKEQEGVGSYNSRRKVEDNKIDIDSKISDAFLHLRACEKRHPAYVFYNNTKYFITIEPEIKPNFPDDLEIIFPDPS